jgi:hypothetical protein
LARLGRNTEISAVSPSMLATTSRPSLMICTIRASLNASTRLSAQYIRSGLASP